MKEYMADAVLFDMDGTLTDTEKYYQEAWPQAFEDFGYKLEKWQTLEMRSLGRPFVQARFREWFGEGIDYDAIHAHRAELIEKILKERGVQAKPGAVEILTWLRAHHILTAVVTSTSYPRTEKQLKEVQLFDCFDKIICADMVQVGKPAPDVYAYACRQLNIDPGRALAVEDSPNGCISAHSAGCHVVMVPDQTEPDGELMKILHARLDTLADIRTLFEKDN